MVKKEIINGKKYYMCEICKFYYNEKKWAEKCENFCKKYNACSIEITGHAVNIKNEK